jgi:hypothetical protein
MDRIDDPFVSLAPATLADDFASLQQRSPIATPTLASVQAPAIGRLQGFDLLERPLVAKLTACPGLVLPARTTQALRHSQIGQEVVVMFEGGDPHSPIILGVIEPHALHPVASPAARAFSVQADGERQLIEAEREIVLRCGEASITLTRAGKVIIQGNYILSRSKGVSKIKGAAIDIN